MEGRSRKSSFINAHHGSVQTNLALFEWNLIFGTETGSILFGAEPAGSKPGKFLKINKF